MAHLERVALIVRDYDEAIGFFGGKLGFELEEDSPSLTNDGRPKRWVVVRAGSHSAGGATNCPASRRLMISRRGTTPLEDFMTTPNIPNLPGMGNAPTLQAQLSTVTGRVLLYCDRAVEGLTVEQFCDTRGGITNSIGWDVWHVVRTIDNIIHFVFERQQPVWLQQSFHERWGLPKVDQGTGQDPDDAYSMRFPEPAEFKQYTKAVHEAVVPRIAAMSNAYLAEAQTIRPWGPIPRMEAILHGLIGHGNGHLGRASYARTLFGLEGLPF